MPGRGRPRKYSCGLYPGSADVPEGDTIAEAAARAQAGQRAAEAEARHLRAELQAVRDALRTAHKVFRRYVDDT